MINRTLALCGTTEKAEAQKNKTLLETTKASIATSSLSTSDKSKLTSQIENEIQDMNNIIGLTGTTTRQKM
ncbi:MAG: hypothetical protein WCH65_01260 [bacterium]